MRSRAGREEVVPGELHGEPLAQSRRIAGGALGGAVRRAREFDRRFVGLRARPRRERGRKRAEHLLAAVHQQPVVALEQHDLLFDPNRIRLRALPLAPGRKLAPDTWRFVSQTHLHPVHDPPKRAVGDGPQGRTERVQSWPSG